MKDLIAKLTMDANCAMGAIWLHIEAREKRIAELEAELAKLRAGAQVVAEPEWIDGRNDDPAEAAFWRFDARKKGYSRWKGAPQSERDAFKAEYRAASTAVQAPVREVPEGWQLVPKEPTAEMCLVFDDYDMSARQIYTGMLAAAPSHKED